MTSERPTISAADLPASARAKLGLKVRRQTMSKDTVRTHALRVMYAIADLTPTDRERILRHALKVNAI
jgi:hypothetical protein